MISRTQRSFSECFFLFVIGGYFLWPYNLQRDPKYQFSDSTEIRLANRSTKYRSNWVSGSHKLQRSFSESFFLFLMLGYFLCPYSLQWDPKYLFSDSTEIRLAKRSTKYRCNSVRWINRTLSSFCESFFPDFIWGYFLFHHSPLWASKYHFAYSTRTLLAKGFLRGKL